VPNHIRKSVRFGLTAFAACTVLATTAAQADAGSQRVRVAAPAVDCRVSRCIALTFDAGPGRYTAQLLDILKAADVRATFFLLGAKHVMHHPDLVARMAAEGNEVGNHTWDHPRLTDISTARIQTELALTQNAIHAITGRTPTMMRPPQGRTNARVAAVCKSLGLAQILWNDRALDWRDHNSALIVHRILAGAHPGGIILLHDIYPGTVPAVPSIISHLKAAGYTLVTIPQLLAPDGPQPGAVYRHG
jgi:peptidoglycan/xylan/chitin deacetylase (PgdA/CDA1 family)